MSKSWWPFFLSEPYDECLINFSAGNKVLGKHEENTLGAEFKHIVGTCGHIINEFLCKRMFLWDNRNNLTRNVQRHFFLFNLIRQSKFLGNFYQIVNRGLVTHSDKLSQHSWVKADWVNAKVFNEWSENIVLFRVAIENEIENFVAISCNTCETIICENWGIDLSLMFFQVFIMGTW